MTNTKISTNKHYQKGKRNDSVKPNIGQKWLLKRSVGVIGLAERSNSDKVRQGMPKWTDCNWGCLVLPMMFLKMRRSHINHQMLICKLDAELWRHFRSRWKNGQKLSLTSTTKHNLEWMHSKQRRNWTRRSHCSMQHTVWRRVNQLCSAVWENRSIHGKGVKMPYLLIGLSWSLFSSWGMTILVSTQARRASWEEEVCERKDSSMTQYTTCSWGSREKTKDSLSTTLGIRKPKISCYLPIYDVLTYFWCTDHVEAEKYYAVRFEKDFYIAIGRVLKDHGDGTASITYLHRVWGGTPISQCSSGPDEGTSRNTYWSSLSSSAQSQWRGMIL